MANASRDGNDVPTLMGVSNADGTTAVPLWADPVSHRLLVSSFAFSGGGAPTSTPTVIGQVYVDTTNNVVYVADGTSSSANWLNVSGTPSVSTTWGSNGNTKTVTNTAVTTSSQVAFMFATPPAGRWAVVCSAGSFVITSSDAEASSLAFRYKVFA